MDGELEWAGDQHRVEEKMEENRSTSTSKMGLHARFRQGQDVAELRVAMASTLPRTTPELRGVPMQVDSQCEASSLC